VLYNSTDSLNDYEVRENIHHDEYDIENSENSEKILKLAYLEYLE
jgi:hypothetical protein